MKKHIKTCPHCKNEFESNHARRIYCSDSHRVSAYNKKKGFKVMLVAPQDKKVKLTVKSENVLKEVEDKTGYNDSFVKQASASALGSVTANLLLNIFTKEENKPTTKKDLILLLNAIRNDQILFRNQIINEIKKNNNYSPINPFL
jgi:hypothetical protein